MPNLAQRIKKNNKKLEKEFHEKNNNMAEPKKLCSCPRGKICPLNGHCLNKNIIYNAKVHETKKVGRKTIDIGTEFYTGAMGNDFKKRLGNHIKSFNHKKYSKETSLAIHIWKIKERGNQYSIEWKQLARANPYNTATKICNLCSKEIILIFKPELFKINIRNEMFRN